MPLITKFQSSFVFGRTPSPEQQKDFNRCLERFEINTPLRIRHFLAQTAYETNGLVWLKELSSGEQYEWRQDLGNNRLGDGKKYKGAGVLQLTGKANYKLFSDYMADPYVMVGCDYVAENYSFYSGGWFWMTQKLNQVADVDDIEKVTRIINGGLNGLEKRIEFYQRALEVV